MGNIYLLMVILTEQKIFLQNSRKISGSPRASGAHFRLSDLCYLDNDHSCAIKHLENKENEIDLQNWEMVHYRKAEVYYNMGELDKR